MTDTEIRVVEIWKEVLEMDSIAVDDDFFEIGGHSLLAMRILSRVQKLFEVEVPLRTFFQNPTVAALGDEIDQMRQAGKVTKAPVYRKVAAQQAHEELLAELQKLPPEEVEKLFRTIEEGRPNTE
jgi:acyl carrier protein